MGKLCPAILECKECMRYREFKHKNELGMTDYFIRCGIDVILEWILKAENSLDGLQASVNQSSNDQLTLMRGLASHGLDAPIKLWQKHRSVRVIETQEQSLLEDKDGIH